MEVTLWDHSSSLPNKSYEEPEPHSSVALDDAPLLVQELAHWQLRSLQAGVSLDSSVLVAAAAQEAPEVFDVVVDGKPLQIPTSGWPSPLQMPLASEQPKTLSSSASGQVRHLNGRFGAIEEISE